MTDQKVAVDGFADTILHNQYGLVWDDDAPRVWMEMCSAPARVDGTDAVIMSSDGVDLALHHPETFSSGPDAGFLGSESGLIPLQVDPPDHARYRRMLDPQFSPRRVATLEAAMRERVNRCIDAFADRGWCDFSDEFSVPFPIGTFLDLLGLPQSGLPEFLRLKENIIRPVAASEEESIEIRRRTGVEISELFNGALTEREAQPRDDLFSYFVSRESSGELSRADSINICHLLLLAGLDTVTGTLECAFALLARRPDLQQVLTDPANVEDAVEELLRWIVTSPMQGRVATRDVEVDGVTIPAGCKVSVVQASLNFDPERFPDPLTVDLARGSSRHATFGIGNHRCLGSHLARLELRIALTEWHRRIPRYHLPAGSEVTYTPSLRGIHHLKLEFDRA